MKVTYLQHAFKRMVDRDIPEEDVRAVLEEPDSEGAANFGRRYSQKRIGHRLIRVIYNEGADEAIVVSVMLRRREGGA